MQKPLDILYIFVYYVHSMNRTNHPLEQEEVLDIFQNIEKNPEITQRELSSSLGISLGKVNFLLKALIEKGIVKTKRFKNSRHKLAYLYILTPQGLKAKAELTRGFLKRKIEEYNRLEGEINHLKAETELIGDKDEPL